MEENIKYEIKGIKCDACDYRDDSVEFEDYENWLNKPCPKCGENLLTEDDLEQTKQMINIFDNINEIPKELLKGLETENVKSYEVNIHNGLIFKEK